MKTSEKTLLLIVFLFFFLSAYFYPLLPEKIASHWNASGQVDGYSSKIFIVLLMPFTALLLYIIFLAIPRIDPLKENIKKFRNYYDTFIAIFFIFLLSVYIQVILWNLGIQINPNLTLPIFFAVLFYYAGIMCENAKRNWFIGIRTPWTLSNEKVWNKTHKIGGKFFKISAFFSILGSIFQPYAIFFVVVPVIFFTVFLFVYSYLLYQKEIKKLK